jgi:hypothetical protein
MGFFAWIEEGVRKAVVRGIEQAADDINSGEELEVTFRLPAHREPLRLSHEEPSQRKASTKK